MALVKQNQTLASDFISLKARVKAEMQRRKYNGDLTKYAGAEWDYVVQPTAGGKLLPEHYNKIIEPLNAIAPTGFNAPIRQGDHAIAIKVAVDKLAEYEKKSPSSGANDCAVSCSGRCTTSCGSNCYKVCHGGGSYGCGVGCSGDCDGGREGDCNTTCSGTCKTGCGGGCKGTCKGGCISSCNQYCNNSCGYGCGMGCGNGCGWSSGGGTTNPGTGA